MRASDVMSAPVVTVREDAPLQDVAALLLERDIGSVPVVDDGGRLLGIVSEADLLELESRLEPRDQILGEAAREARCARDVMTRDVVTVDVRDGLAMIARLMLDGRMRHVPVMSAGALVGIVSRHDLLRVLARSDAEIGADIQARIREEALPPDTYGGVQDGVVTLRAERDAMQRELLSTLVRGVPGVTGVEFVDAR